MFILLFLAPIYAEVCFICQIKKLDPASRRVSTLAGTGEAGFRDGGALAAQVGRSFFYVSTDV